MPAIYNSVFLTDCCEISLFSAPHFAFDSAKLKTQSKQWAGIHFNGIDGTNFHTAETGYAFNSVEDGFFAGNCNCFSRADLSTTTTFDTFSGKKHRPCPQ